MTESPSLASPDLRAGLPDRNAFMQRLDAALRMSERVKSGFALLLVDAGAGDDGAADVQRVAAAIRHSVRLTDTVATLNSKEFAVLLSVGNEDGAQRVARKIFDSASEGAQHSELGGGLAIGVALYPAHGETREALLRAADAALYQARRNHGIVMAVRDEQPRAQAEAPALGQQLGTALEQNEFVLRFQPIVALGSGRAIATEALVRWRHPELGLLPPGEFLHLAALDTTLDTLSLKLIERAIQQAHAWHQEGIHLPLSLNLSHSTLELEALEQLIVRRLQDYNLPADHLTLELRDEQLTHLPAGAMKALFSLAAAGVRLSIDDFGRGTASLHALRDLPVHEIKIDPSLVVPVCRSTADAAIIKALAQLGRDLGKRVVAKGIESAEIRDKLVSLGCEYGQGFHFAQALEPEVMARWQH